MLIECQASFASYIISPTHSVQFAYKNVLHTETYAWPRTLINYPVSFDGDVSESDLVLINNLTGQSKLFQLSDCKRNSGRLISATVNFMAELPQDGSFNYEFKVQRNNKSEAKQSRMVINRSTDEIEIIGNKLSIFIPESHTVNAHETTAVIKSISQGGNNRIGNNKILSPKKIIRHISSETIEHGSLFVTQRLCYEFADGGSYRVNVKLVNDYPFAIIDEEMQHLSPSDSISMSLQWSGFSPDKRFGTQWDRTLESDDVWLGIDAPVYTGYSKEDPHWTGDGVTEDPSKEMIYKILPFSGNSVREQTPVMSFWEERGGHRELGIFVYDNMRWNDCQYGLWQPSQLLSICFRYTGNILYFTYPLITGTRSTAISLFDVSEGEQGVRDFNTRLSSLAKRGGKHAPEDIYYRYSQLLLMRYASLSLNRIKEWQLSYPLHAKHPENLFVNSSGRSREEFIREISISPMAYYPMGLNFYPGIHSIEHRIVYTNYIEDYLRFRETLDDKEREGIEGLLIIGAYVNMLEEMNAIRNSLAGTPNMASDGWCFPAHSAFLFPEHSQAKEWTDYVEKSVQLYGLFYTRPDVTAYESRGGRWAESMGIYNWAYLRPTSHANIAAEMYDGKNRFASPYMVQRAHWMLDMLTAPIGDGNRFYPPHGAHGGGYLVPRYAPFFQLAEWLKYYDPLVAEKMFWTGTDGEEVEKKARDTDWHIPYKKLHPETNTGTNPHLKSCKYTGHGIVLRAATNTSKELSIHLNQVDKGPNYRWGNQGEGNTGGLYFYAQGKVYTAHENEIAGDHIVNNLDGVTNFGVMKNGDYRTVGMNELKAPLYDFGVAQFAELRSDNGVDRYVWPDYLSRSIMLAGDDYFVIFDEIGINWRGAGRFSWFNAKGKEFPHLVFLSSPARKDGWTTVQTNNSTGFYRDNFGSLLTLVTHKKNDVKVEDGTLVTIPLLGNKDISDFRFNNDCALPKGVVRIATEKSHDMIFRNDKMIRYSSPIQSFEGNAGMLRRMDDGTLTIVLFKGSRISADNLTLELLSAGQAAAAITRSGKGELTGKLKTDGQVLLRLSGIAPHLRLFVNGKKTDVKSKNGVSEISFPKGEYQLEYTTSECFPMRCEIADCEYENNRVKVMLAPTSTASRYAIEVSNDGGANWVIHGYTTNKIYYLSQNDTGKIHVRAVAVNGNKKALEAPEYPVYFSNTVPHHPEGLWLRLDHNKVEFSWGQVLGANNYRLYRRIKGDIIYKLVYEGKDRYCLDLTDGIRKHYAHPGRLDNRSKSLDGLVIYEYCVTAVTGNGESVYSPSVDTDPASWRNWYPNTELRFKRQSAFWLPPYVRPEQSPERYYPE